MGSGNRKTSSNYVAPNIGASVSVVCPNQFGRVPIVTRAAVAPGVEYQVLSTSDSIVATRREGSVVAVLDAPEDLVTALAAGCRYIASVSQSLEAGHLAVAEIALE